MKQIIQFFQEMWPSESWRPSEPLLNASHSSIEAERDGGNQTPPKQGQSSGTKFSWEGDLTGVFDVVFTWWVEMMFSEGKTHSEIMVLKGEQARDPGILDPGEWWWHQCHRWWPQDFPPQMIPKSPESSCDPFWHWNFLDLEVIDDFSLHCGTRWSFAEDMWLSWLQVPRGPSECPKFWTKIPHCWGGPRNQAIVGQDFETADCGHCGPFSLVISVD